VRYWSLSPSQVVAVAIVFHFVLARVVNALLIDRAGAVMLVSALSKYP